ncbi:hypothetical protein [Oceanobacillus rekensis]|uniref:hypothetical protein n=1 Tax=Oceanobacillus rekensis TaxID=937927 RepID=UPI000B4405B2|nr:hypothetical protein [Oceanobacillus rekensis]
MQRYKLYNSDDVEKLQRELDIYKYTLETVKSQDGVNGYLKTKSDFNDLQLKYSKLKGEMKIMEENHQRRVTEYELEKQFLSTRMNTVSESVSQLKQDMNWMMDRMEQIRFTELLEKMNQVMNKQDDHLIETKIKIERLKEEILQLKEYIESDVPTPEPAKEPPAPKKSEYRQLQNMLRSPSYIEEASSKKKNMTTRQNFRHPLPSSQTIHPTNASNHVQDSAAVMNMERNAFPHYLELNKNIIIRPKATKNKQEEKKAESNIDKSPSITVNNNTPPLHEESSMKKNVEENPVKETIIEKHSEPNIELPNKQEANFLAPKDFTRDTPIETIEKEIQVTEKEIPAADKQNIVEEKSSQEQKQPSPKKETGSFFSIFQKKD